MAGRTEHERERLKSAEPKSEDRLDPLNQDRPRERKIVRPESDDDSDGAEESSRHAAVRVGSHPDGRVQSGLRPAWFSTNVDPSPEGDSELVQQDLVQALPDGGCPPIPQAAPAGHPAATAQFLGQHLPGDATLQDKDDAGQDTRFGSGVVPHRLGRIHRQQRFDDRPQFVAYELLVHTDRVSNPRHGFERCCVWCIR